MKVLERNENTLIIKLSDGVAIIDIRELIHGDDDTIIGTSFHEDFPAVPQAIKRYSTTTQMILSFLITGR
jgi:hypothetical protein